MQQSAGDWTAVVSFAQTAPYGAGKVFALGYTALLELPLSNATSTNGTCRPGSCAQLPGLVSNDTQNDQRVLVGDLLCRPSAAQAANYYLGGMEVALPVQATFIPMWSAGGGSYVDATSLGLPLRTLESDTLPNPGLQPTPGPGGGPGMEFYFAEGLPPLVYQRIFAAAVAVRSRVSARHHPGRFSRPPNRARSRYGQASMRPGAPIPTATPICRSSISSVPMEARSTGGRPTCATQCPSVHCRSWLG